jgi:hypothetical protein
VPGGHGKVVGFLVPGGQK